MHPHLQFMQDGALSHSAASTKNELLERGIYITYWPLYSPGLNLIETIQNWIKDYIENRFGDVQLSYDDLQAVVKEGWEAITTDQLNSLIDSMKGRCEAVIAAQGGAYQILKCILPFFLQIHRTVQRARCSYKSSAGYHPFVWQRDFSYWALQALLPGLACCRHPSQRDFLSKPHQNALILRCQ